MDRRRLCLRVWRMRYSIDRRICIVQIVICLTRVFILAMVTYQDTFVEPRGCK